MSAHFVYNGHYVTLSVAKGLLLHHTRLFGRNYRSLRVTKPGGTHAQK